MTTARKFIWGKLNDPSITILVGDTDPRIFAKKTMTSSKEHHPFVVYKLGNDTSEEFSEERDVTRQFFQVWVHDFNDGKTADYAKIDEVILAIKNVFKNAGGIPGVWTTRYLETSQDLDDDTLNTVFRYLRFQLIREDVPS
jgi:hypothetical protein